MYEMVIRIIAHTAEVQPQRGIAQGEGRDARNADVYRFSLNVHAAIGNAAGGAMEKGVGLRRAISADDVDFSVGVADGLVELIEKIEEAGVHVVILMNAPVAEKAIELSFCRWQVVIALTINNIEAAARVQVIKHETVGFGRGRLSYGWDDREEQKEYSETAAADLMGKPLTTHGASLL